MVFLFVLMIGVVCAANGWGDVNVGDDATGDVPVVSNDTFAGDVPPIVSNVSGSSDAETRYTQDFYIALGVAGGGILIILLFIYLFIRGSKNKWKKK